MNAANENGNNPILTAAGSDARTILRLAEAAQINAVSLPIALVVAAVAVAEAQSEVAPDLSADEVRAILSLLATSLSVAAVQVEEMARATAR